MRDVEFEEGFKGWREQARALLAEAIPPESVRWHPTPQKLLPSLVVRTDVKVPRRFLAIAKRASWNRAPEKWHLMYRVLWRLTHEDPKLLESIKDRDARDLADLDGEVRRELRHLRTRVHFRSLPDGGERERLVAYYAPKQPVLAAWVPEICARHAVSAWSMWTPEESWHWDLFTLTKAAGARMERGETLETFWNRVRAQVPREQTGALRFAGEGTGLVLIGPRNALNGAAARLLARAMKLAKLSSEAFRVLTFAEVERLETKPEGLLVLGRDAAREVLGMPVTLEERRGRVSPTLWSDLTAITIDPFTLFSIGEESEREAEFQRLVSDLERFGLCIASTSGSERIHPCP